MLYRSRGLWATANTKTATIRDILLFRRNLKIRVRLSTLEFSKPAEKTTISSNSRRFKGFYLTLLPPFAFFEKRGFQKKNCGWIFQNQSRTP